ncbi:hypothetical protein IV203_030865 [Nitzschia inconspicua]|uniref:CRAL-TRIO domain-containing protein n=1 Tax=Nitzschia inconspicua TaxID=303405 RepID=A0A9K3LU63_9STRA|nr:hypothetical protein IV203_030865 [Nitzschia inconspicua]
MTDSLSKKLQEEFPDSPEAECIRFAQAAERAFEFSRKRNKEQLIQQSALQNLEHYHDWRSCYGIDFDKVPLVEDDAAVWKWAVEKAIGAARAKEESQRQLVEAQTAKSADEEPALVDYDSFIDDAVKKEEQGKDNEDEAGNSSEAVEKDETETTSVHSSLPQIIFKRVDPKTGDLVRDKEDNVMFHVLAARIDRFAASHETWALAISLYLEIHFDRRSKDLFALFIDARAGEGWANPQFLMVVSLTRSIVHSVATIHPGRWQSIVIFPLPRAVLGIWKTIKGYFHPEIASVMKLVSGPARLGSRLPKGFLLPFVDDETLDFLEQCRAELYDTHVDEIL